jgi:hypothetical protein
VLALCLAGGCSTTGSHVDSTSPWNEPRHWEQAEIHNDGSVESNTIMIAGHLFVLGEFIAAILRR